MTAIVQRHLPIWAGFIGLLAGLIALESWVVASNYFRQAPDTLATAVTVDLILTPPLLGWLFLIRTRRLPIFALIPMTVLGTVTAFLIVPAEHRHALRALETIVPVIELGILTLILFRFRKALRHYRAARADNADSIDALEQAIGAALDSPRAGAIAATEFTILRYGIAGWFTKTPPADDRTFSYHRRAGYPAILGVISLVMFMEILGLHFLLMRWTPIAAWIATLLGVYSALWIYGDYHAGRLNPIRLVGDELHVRTGFRWKVRVPLSAVAAVHATEPSVPAKERVAFVFMGQPDFWVELQQPRQVSGIFGISRRTRWLGLGADDAEGLRKRIAPGSAPAEDPDPTSPN